MAALLRLGKVSPKTSALFVCDMQEKFRKTIQFYPEIINVAGRMLETAKVLEIPVITTEQYPKGLGPTVSELDVSWTKVIVKTNFSMCVPETVDALKEMKDVKSIILVGLETQACVLNTTLDLLESGYDVHVIADAVSSRSQVDRKFAFERMRDVGAFITTSECAILALAGGSHHPKFKDLQKIIWDSAPDSDLL